MIGHAALYDIVSFAQFPPCGLSLVTIAFLPTNDNNSLFHTTPGEPQTPGDTIAPYALARNQA